MGSFKRPERSDKARRVRHARVNRVQPVRLPGMEPLEARRMLDVGIGYNTITQPPNWHATNNNISDLTNGPLANAGQTLESIYQGYEAFAVGAGPGATYNSPLSSQIEFQGNYVGVRVNTWGDFNSAQTALQNIGMQIAGTDSTYGIFEGYLPISQLLTVAKMPMTISLSPISKPILNYQGAAYNEARSRRCRRTRPAPSSASMELE